jgi:hypothetical protein
LDGQAQDGAFPREIPWPETGRAEESPWHVDPEWLMKVLSPLTRHSDDLSGGGANGVRDVGARLGPARAAGAWGTWPTADNLNAFHGAVTEQYIACYAELLAQLARVARLAGRNARRTAGADEAARDGFIGGGGGEPWSR